MEEIFVSFNCEANPPFISCHLTSQQGHMNGNYDLVTWYMLPQRQLMTRDQNNSNQGLQTTCLQKNGNGMAVPLIVQEKLEIQISM